MRLRLLAPLLLSVLLAACGRTGGTSSGAAPGCGDGRRAPGEACDDGPRNSDFLPDACRRDCTLPRCGDAVVDAGEGCDEGESSGGGVCRRDCALPTCGDGILDPGEGCDDGAANGALPDACRATCVPPSCGDGVVDAGEGCDDGPENATGSPDVCRPGCVAPACGDGVTDTGEGCDDGERNSDRRPDTCRTDCAPARCGDGVIDAGETCDDASGNSDVRPGACRTTCAPARCGDGVVDPGEACDEGGPDGTGPGGCRPGCALDGCGDGVVDPGEACDDGPANSDREPDRCRTTCVLAFCGDGVRDGGEACDAGPANSDDVPGACRTTCMVASCGDGVVDEGEGCDDGLANSDVTPDACRTDCTPDRCGDGVIDHGEYCDDGNATVGDGCHLCAFHPGYCGGALNHDLWLTGTQVPDGWTYEGTFTGGPGYMSSCGGYTAAVRFGVPIWAEGDLVARASATGGIYGPAVSIGTDPCPGSTFELACAVASTSGSGASATAIVRDVEPADAIRWVMVQPAFGTPGGFRLDVRVRPRLAISAPCRPDGTLGRCQGGLVCGDPDGDGAGACVPARAHGESCDPAGLLDGCAGGTCTGGVCVSFCGNGASDPGEECDDGNRVDGDGCTAACELPGKSCAAPFPLDWARDPATGRATWNGDTRLGASTFGASCGRTGTSREAYATFTAPVAGRYGFDLVPASFTAALVVGAGSCGPTAAELACGAGLGSGEPVSLQVDLAAGQTVWIAVDGSGASAQGGAFALAAERVVCGDGVVGLGEECDDGNLVDEDNCSASCRAAGDDCARPHQLGWDAAAGQARWAGVVGPNAARFTGSCSTSSTAPDSVGRFVAPFAGRWSFELADLSFPGVLSLRSGSCGMAGSSELGCRAVPSSDSPRVVAVNLAAGEEVWAVVDSTTSSLYRGTFVLTVRPAVCGDGTRALAEECDDGNLAAGDGCGPTCLLDSAEAEPNGDTATAVPIVAGTVYRAALSPAADVDVYRFDAVAGVAGEVELWAGAVGACFGEAGRDGDLEVQLLDAAGSFVTRDDDGGIGLCPKLSFVPAASGTHYLLVRSSTMRPARAVPAYYLQLR